MYEILYKPLFVRQYKKFPEDLQNDVKRTIESLKMDPKNNFLKTHKLKGKLKKFWSCSVNYSYRIVFEYEKPDKIVCLMVGNHDIYN